MRIVYLLIEADHTAPGYSRQTILGVFKKSSYQIAYNLLADWAESHGVQLTPSCTRDVAITASSGGVTRRIESREIF